jgi:hypothetical protein
MTVMGVKSVDYFIGGAHKTINGIHRVPEFFIEGPDTAAERGAVFFGDQLAALKAGLGIKVH